MKKSTKKLLTISGSILGVGAITTSITLPILLNAGRPSLDLDRVLYEHTNEDGTKTNLTVRDALERIKKSGHEDKTQLNRFDYYTAFFLYEMEQKASLKLQEMWFKWDIYDLDNQIKNLDNNPSLQKDQEAKEKKAKELREQKDKVNERLRKIQNALKEKDPIGLDYNSSSFKNDYPKVLLPLHKVRDEQSRVYNDTKNNEIGKFTTRNQGEIAWELKRRENYNDAATDEEAIDFLTNKAISEKSFGQFKFKIHSDYTYEQKWFKDSEGNFVFSFLEEATQKRGLPNNPDFDAKDKDEDKYVGKSDRETKVYFIGSNSSDPTKIYLDLTKNDGINGEILNKISNQELIKIQHALIAIKQNEGGSSLPWEFIKGKDDENAKDPLENLLSFFGNETNPSLVLDILKNVFKDGKDDDTKTFIDYFSHDKSGKGKDGSLGVKTLLEYIKDFEPGFTFGILAILENNGQELQDERKNKNYLEILSDNLKQAMEDVWGINGPKNQDQLIGHVKALTDKEKEVFGRAIKNTFDPDGKGLKLFYPAGDGVNIVMTQNGIHIVKITPFSDLNKLKNEIGEDLLAVAKDNDESKTKTDWGKLFSNYFSGNNRRKFIIDNFSKDGKLKEYIEEKESRRKKEQRISWKKITDLITSIENSQKIKDILESLGNKTSDFYIKGINNLLLEEDPTLKPDDIYKIIIEKMLKGEGATNV